MQVETALDIRDLLIRIDRTLTGIWALATFLGVAWFAHNAIAQWATK